MAFPFAAIAAIATVVGAGVSVVGALQQKKAQEKANKSQEAQAAIQNRQRRVRAFREAQQKQAAVENQAAASGVTSSGYSGQLGSLATNLASSAGDFNASSLASRQYSDAMGDLGRAGTLSSIGSGLQTLGQFGFQNADRLNGLMNNAAASPTPQLTQGQNVLSGNMSGSVNRMSNPSITKGTSVFDVPASVLGNPLLRGY